ncbi:MAG: hypothetical protein SGILL_009279, partial [Bacillariaceae sp.]
APDVAFVAAKACLNTAPVAICPDFALIAGIEYLLDPKGDGSMNDRVDVINLSLGAPYNNPAHDLVALMLEYATELGVVTVTSIGNGGNVPYVSGAIGTTPNVVTVGAVNDQAADTKPRIEWYSSRGPGMNNAIKPDITAPSQTQMAVHASGDGFTSFEGSSFCSPLVAGAAARILEKCAGSCSPFVVKAMLMNNADDKVFSTENEQLAPVTLMGSGLYDAQKTLQADFWAYSLEDVQPAINLGFFINVDQSFVIQRSIQITNLNPDGSRDLSITSEFRDPIKSASGAVEITFSQTRAQLPANCGDSIVVNVDFSVNAILVPPNTMSSSGTNGISPEAFDRHEYGGFIVIESFSGSSIALPFLLILRQAARPSIIGGSLPTLYGPVDINLTIANPGAGTAQLDAYQLIVSSPDEAEAPYGTEEVSADVRSIGYRIIPVFSETCQHLIEFSINLWETVRYVGEVTIGIDVYQDLATPPVTVWTQAVPFSPDAKIILPDGSITCTGLHPDHASNSGNIIVRACSDDLMLDGNGTIHAQFKTAAYPEEISTLWTSDIVEIAYPTPNLQAHSYNIASGETLENFRIFGSVDRSTFGMQLVANAYRDKDSTGAATTATETLMVVRQGIVLPTQTTPEGFIPLPVAQNISGPDCSWHARESSQPCQRKAGNHGNGITSASTSNVQPLQQDLVITEDDIPDCTPVEVPRLSVPTHGPSVAPIAGPVDSTKAPVPSSIPEITSNPSSTTEETGETLPPTIVTSSASTRTSVLVSFCGGLVGLTVVAACVLLP